MQHTVTLRVEKVRGGDSRVRLLKSANEPYEVWVRERGKRKDKNKQHCLSLQELIHLLGLLTFGSPAFPHLFIKVQRGEQLLGKQRTCSGIQEAQ